MNDDFAILASVAAEPTHPFRVLDHLNAIGLKANRSTVYRRVDALVEAGDLIATRQPGVDSHVRKVLALSPAGHERVAMEAAQVIASEPMESPYFTLAVACADAIEPGHLDGLLRTRMAGAARSLTAREHELRRDPGDADWTRFARQRRVAHLQADVSWLQSTIARRQKGIHLAG